MADVMESFVFPCICIPLVSFVDSALLGAVQSLITSVLQMEPCQGTQAVAVSDHLTGCISQCRGKP